MKWDYELEDPHQDARGFRAAELLQDTDEAAYFEIDKNRPLSFEEIKSDLVLSNGARFYNDHAHPEYSTPECSTLKRARSAGQSGRTHPRRVRAAAEQEAAARPRGANFTRTTPISSATPTAATTTSSCAATCRGIASVADIVPFLVTRQIFAGAGKMGIEGESMAGAAGRVTRFRSGRISSACSSASTR